MIIKRKVMIKIFLSFILVLGLSYLIITNNLIIDEQPVESDVIIVTEGQNFVRAFRASELLHAGFSESNQIIVSPINEANSQGYQKFGITKENIIPETLATSTYENAIFTLELMTQYKFESAIVVSSDYHMLRTKLIYERINRNYDYDLTYVAAYHFNEDELVPWYEAGLDAHQSARREFWKYLGYVFGMYHFFNL